MIPDKFIEYALAEGFYSAAVIDTKDIVFDPSFRPYCEENLCGQYNANYTCPPICGTTEEMKQKILSHKHAVVLQTKWNISDYTDRNAIKHAKGEHNDASIRLAKQMRADGYDGFIVGASGCALCSPCAMTENKPCRFPNFAFSCMSAYCIFVRLLAEHCGMEYSCADGRLAFFGMYVFD